jgi:hypothetical protein
VRKLLSIGIVLALLVTFVVPVIVAAQDNGDNGECCGWTPPEAAPLPDRTTKTLAGAAMWTMLGVSDIMGKAVCATTGQMAANLGGWSDELGVIAVDVTASALSGIGDLIPALLSALGLDAYADLGDSLASFLSSIADALKGAA